MWKSSIPAPWTVSAKLSVKRESEDSSKEMSAIFGGASEVVLSWFSMTSSKLQEQKNYTDKFIHIRKLLLYYLFYLFILKFLYQFNLHNIYSLILIFYQSIC